MKVILLKDHKGLGKKDQVVEASEGFVTNFLIPKKIAILHTKTSSEILNKNIEKQKANEAEILANAKEVKKELQASNLVFTLKQNHGKVFGSISNKEIAEKIKSELNITVDKHNITSPTLNSLGEETITIALHKEVKAQFKITIKGI